MSAIDHPLSFKLAEEERFVIERTAMLSAVQNTHSFNSLLYPMITFFDKDEEDNKYWAGATAEERKNNRDQYQEALRKYALDNRKSIEVHGASKKSPFFEEESIARKSAMHQALAVLKIRSENAAVDHFLLQVDSYLANKKVVHLDKTPLRLLGDELFNLSQSYAEVTVDAGPLLNETSHHRAERVSKELHKNLVELASALVNDSRVLNSTDIISITWIVACDPIIHRYLELDPYIKQSVWSAGTLELVSTLNLSMINRCFIVPRVTFKNGLTQTFGMQAADLGAMLYSPESTEQPRPCHHLSHADELHTKLPIVGQVRITGLEDHRQVAAKKPK